MHLTNRRVGACITLLVGLVCAVGFLPLAVSAAATPAAKEGGTVTDLVVAGSWPGFDPATDNIAVETPEANAIFGQLFELGPNATILPDLATGYAVSNKGLTWDIHLRKGVKFTNGSPLTSADVAWNWNRDLTSATCTCESLFTDVQLPVTTHGLYDVRINMKAQFSPLVPDMIGEAPNYVASEQAWNSMGQAAFAQAPVGAGPFQVVSDSASATLVLTKNPHYWEKGHPYLSGMKFLATSSDQADYSALESGQANFSIITTVSLVEQAEHTSGLSLHKAPVSTVAFVNLNNQAPPFNNPLAREAVTYATNSKALVDALYGGLYTPVEGLTSPSMLFYEKKVPGYDSYNLTKAEALVQQLGGLTVTLRTLTNSPTAIQESEALESMWEAAGIKVNLIVESIQQTIAVQFAGGFQAVDGGFLCEPDPSSCVGSNYGSTGQFSTTKDPALDGLIDQGTLFANMGTRQKVYDKIYSLIAKNANADFLYSPRTFYLTASNVMGVGPQPTGGQEAPENIWIK
jgi:ABC-type transport system substrate-binding protein